jgi:hypothetical protein
MEKTYTQSHPRGCQIVYCQTKNTNLGKFLRFLQWKLVHLALWHILWQFGMYFFPFWYVVLRRIWQPWSPPLAKAVPLKLAQDKQKFGKSDKTFVAICRHTKLCTATEDLRDLHRVARWYIFIPKIPIWVNYGVPWNGIFWYI